MADKFAPSEGGKFAPSLYTSNVEEARDFATAHYFRDLCDVYEEIRAASSLSDDAAIIDHLKYPAVPIHIRPLRGLYAGDVSDSPWSGGEEPPYSQNTSDLCFPLGTAIVVGDKVRLHANENHGEAWFTITTTDDFSTDALMVVARGTRTGVPDGIDQE